MMQQHERLLKVLVIGDLGVGKTSIIKRYVHQVFSQHYRATIGVDFALKVLNWDHKTVVRLQLWDIAGQERYGNMTRVYYREAVGALVVFDMTRLSTFQAVLKWKGDLDSKVALSNGRTVPAVLLANKCDQRRQGLCPKLPKLENFTREYGFVGWYETSAKVRRDCLCLCLCVCLQITLLMGGKYGFKLICFCLSRWNSRSGLCLYSACFPHLKHKIQGLSRPNSLKFNSNSLRH
ncbi:ras-related protein Rab-38 isoform X1 [Siniperca chuatsi]|uniref:ras-related protein Rab-38 isoform X1 n=1 Tax=Siniperca chuatsi TaxID=119488 RepID=UPI001CE03AB1|nr:ras-related protein Rab-38 isoform X1 [Siniperca chuatsi]XP_044040463.1 ras-related protein Rab-38 isoform X1 [Siniperca chuatsi]